MAISKAEVQARIADFKRSEKLMWMNYGERYYKVENDILTLDTNHDNQYKADERLVHSTYRNLVDEKVSFLFAKNPVITNGDMDQEDSTELQEIKEQLGKNLSRTFTMLGTRASNNAIAWLQPYIQDNQLKWHVHDSREIVPIWRDYQERELEAVIQFYTVEEFNEANEQFEQVEYVAVFEEEGATYYTQESGELRQLSDKDAGYFTLDGEPYTWGRVPFIPFFNNMDEVPDIKVVKTLIDAYDKGRSESQNFIEDIRSFIMVLKGYSGDSLEGLVDSIKRYGAIALDPDEGAGVDALNAQMNIGDTLNHFSQLKRDLFDNAQAVNKDIQSLGSSPTNLTLKFLFAGLNLKADKMETEFRSGFYTMLEFVSLFFSMMNRSVDISDIQIAFNRDMTMNESELIADINKSVDLSLTTRLEMHPYVQDVQVELERLDEEQNGQSLTRPVDLEEVDEPEEEQVEATPEETE